MADNPAELKACERRRMVIRNFSNEKGSRVHLCLEEDRSDPDMCIFMRGPLTVAQWNVTLAEAHELHNALGEYLALTPSPEVGRLVEELRETFAPFLAIGTQFPETVKLIDKKLDGMTCVTLTVTKAQFLAAHETLPKLLSALSGLPRPREQADD